MREQRISRLIEPGREERFEIFRRLGLQPGKVGIEATEQKRANPRAGLTRAKAPHLGLLENVVAPEYLVCAFSGENHLEPTVVNQLCERKKGCRRGSQDRPLGV